MDRKSNAPPTFTRVLPSSRAFHIRNSLDVAQNVGRVIEAVVLSPVHLVQQVTGNQGKPVRWVRPSRHQQRMDARPEGERKLREAQRTDIRRTLEAIENGTEGPPDCGLYPERKRSKIPRMAWLPSFGVAAQMEALDREMAALDRRVPARAPIGRLSAGIAADTAAPQRVDRLSESGSRSAPF